MQLEPFFIFFPRSIKFFGCALRAQTFDPWNLAAPLSVARTVLHSIFSWQFQASARQSLTMKKLEEGMRKLHFDTFIYITEPHISGWPKVLSCISKLLFEFGLELLATLCPHGWSARRELFDIQARHLRWKCQGRTAVQHDLRRQNLTAIQRNSSWTSHKEYGYRRVKYGAFKAPVYRTVWTCHWTSTEHVWTGFEENTSNQYICIRYITIHCYTVCYSVLRIHFALHVFATARLEDATNCFIQLHLLNRLFEPVLQTSVLLDARQFLNGGRCKAIGQSILSELRSPNVVIREGRQCLLSFQYGLIIWEGVR